MNKTKQLYLCNNIEKHFFSHILDAGIGVGTGFYDSADMSHEVSQIVCQYINMNFTLFFILYLLLFKFFLDMQKFVW